MNPCLQGDLKIYLTSSVDDYQCELSLSNMTGNLSPMCSGFVHVVICHHLQSEGFVRDGWFELSWRDAVSDALLLGHRIRWFLPNFTAKFVLCV